MTYIRASIRFTLVLGIGLLIIGGWYYGAGVAREQPVSR